MDKEAEKRIATIFEDGLIAQDKIIKGEIEGSIMTFKALAENFAYVAMYTLEGLGYRKIEGEPPLLSNEEIGGITGFYISPRNVAFAEAKKVAKAQRDLDIKWYKGETTK